MSREMILSEIDVERKRQKRLFGTTFDALNTPNDWVAYITRYVAEGAYYGRAQQYNPERFRDCLLKAAAICVAAIEIIDSKGACAPRHYE